MMRGAALFGSFILFVACNTILGNEDDYRVAPSQDECVLTSDCPRGKVCIFKTCSPPCAGDVDCPVGSRCLKTDDGTACVTRSLAACSGSSCPEGSVCISGQCRNPCKVQADCLGSQVCLNGVCIGTDPTRDPAAGGTGQGGNSGDGGSGGTAGTPPVSTGGSGAVSGSSTTGGAVKGGAAGEAGGDAGGEGGAPPCVPTGTEDCLNGVDDDCNGQIDCEDEACGATECVPDVSGAELGTLLPMGSSCPPGYTPITLHRGLIDSFACEGCSCRPVAWRCQSGVYGHGSFPCPSFQFSGPLYNLFSGQCNPLPVDPMLHYYPVSGFTECEPEGVGVPTPVSWEETRTFCKADRVGGGCPSGQRCVKSVSTPRCAMSEGEKSCGASYPDDIGGSFNLDYVDERTCTCSCAFGTANCAGGYIEAYSGGACTGTPVPLGNGAEGDACPLSITPQSARIIANPTSPSCPSNTFPFGDVTPTAPRTVCCE